MRIHPVPIRVPIRDDGIQLEQVFTNLIRNAIESRAEGVRIRIRGDIRGGEIRIRVSDYGPGLGLSVAHGIVEAHGRSLRLDPEVVRGASLLVRLSAIPPGTSHDHGMFDGDPDE